MKITVKGANVNLTDRDYITEGGEGKIYGRGATIYKLYIELSKMIPMAKIQELQVLDKPNILRPLDVIYQGQDRVGFTMAWVKNTTPLVRLFTTAFRNTIGFTPQKTVDLVEKMQQDTHFIHTKGCLVVDYNEFNFLLNNKFNEVYFIDVDSYGTPSFKPTAIMPSIQDYHTQGFNELSDWYSFGIISCQLFVGIHPFKGKHPSLPNDLESRMRNNVSIFNKDVRVPASTRAFNDIPSEYLKWYEEIFERGKRTPPPLIAGMLRTTPVMAQIIPIVSKRFTITSFYKSTEDIYSFFAYNGHNVIIQKDSVRFDQKKIAIDTSNASFMLTPKLEHLLKISIENNRLRIDDLVDKTVEIMPLEARAFTTFNDRVLVQGQDKITAVQFWENGKIKPVTDSYYNILPNSTTMYRGVVYSDVLGVPHLIIPYVKVGNTTTSYAVLKVDMLKGYRIVDAKYIDSVCMVIAFKNGKYDRFTFLLNKDYQVSVLRLARDVTITNLNFIVLDNGICINLMDDGKIETFYNSSDKVMEIEDPAMGSDIQLVKSGVQALFIKGNEIFKFSNR